MSLPVISPAEAKQLIDRGAVLVDIRNPDEYARERIPGARNQPVDKLSLVDGASGPVIFHCKSGARTAAHAAKLSSASSCEAFIVEGGLEGWKRAGLPVVADRRQPIELMRQVQIAAGGLVLLGVTLATIVDQRLIGIAAFVGAGLVMAGVTGWCGMARLLAAMPWNKAAPTA